MQEQSLFIEALEREDPAERSAFLKQACAGNDEMRERIERLLERHLETAGFLDPPLIAPSTVEDRSERVGMQIGPYKVLEQIGEGGFGIVFMAEQMQPVRRKVALKILKPGMDTRQVVARFEVERQVLALMDHPNIARVFDGGSTASGRPYFVMELVKGIPITDFCDQNHLTPRQRLELFISICQAVQHAHQKGIIHRDLKPSNVLVTMHDALAVVKVIDFGVAKALGQELTDKTVFTGFAQMIGTPLYMSPEQAGQSALDVDTRSDIYSLGVLLYELLTGTTPFQKERLHQASYEEIRRIIREEEPPRPSTRISTLGEASATVSAKRGSDAKKLGQVVRGELDWIVMKALEKDRRRRYESASAFAADIQRYLHDEPVQACPPSTWYRLRKLGRRHKATLVSAAALLVMLLLAVVGLSAGFLTVQKEQKETEKALKREEAAKAKLEESLKREQQVLTFQRFALAERELAVNNIGRAESLLEECPEDLRGLEWRLLKGLHAGPQVLRGSGSWILDAAISPDGKRVAAAGLGPLSVLGELLLWDADNGRPLGSFAGHVLPPICVAFSPDGTKLASGGIDGNVFVWDVQTRKRIHKLSGHSNIVVSVAFHPDGTRLASAGLDHTARIWDVASGEEKVCYRGHGSATWCVSFSPDGSRVASWGLDDLVRLWDPRTGADLKQLKGHSGRVFHLAFQFDGKRIASSGARGLTLWDTTTGENLQALQGVDNASMRAVFSPDGKRLIAGCWDRTVKIWDVESGRETLVLRGHREGVYSVGLSADGSRLVSAGFDGTVRLWYPPPTTVPIEQRPRVLRGHKGDLGAMIFSADGRRMASCGLDLTIRLWDVSTGKTVHVLKGHTEPVTSLAFSADGKQLISVSFEGTMMFWDVETGELLRARPRHIGSLLTTGFAAAFGPGGEGIATTPDDVNVQVWDVPTGKLRWQQPLGFEIMPPMSLAYSGDGQRVAAAARWAIKVWDAKTGKQIARLGGPDHIVHFLVFHPDGKQLAAASWDGLVTLWNLETGKKVRTFQGHTDRVLCVAFSPDGKQLASSGSDNTAIVWDVQSGTKLATLTGHIGYVMSLAYSGDGKLLATGSGHRYQGEVQLWDTTAFGKK